MEQVCQGCSAKVSDLAEYCRVQFRTPVPNSSTEEIIVSGPIYCINCLHEMAQLLQDKRQAESLEEEN